jgi:hypothetical protein
MDREWVEAIYVHARCRIGAEKWGQHQLRHRDRTSPGLCKVLHIEKRKPKALPSMLFITRGLDFAPRLVLGWRRATVRVERNCAEVG